MDFWSFADAHPVAFSVCVAFASWGLAVAVSHASSAVRRRPRRPKKAPGAPKE